MGPRFCCSRRTDADKAQGKKDADQFLADAIKRFGSQQAVEEQVKAAGKTYDQWRAKGLQQATATAVLIRVLNATPTDAEVQKYYDDNPTIPRCRNRFGSAISCWRRGILTTGAPLSEDQVQAKRKQIDDLLKRARAGEDFTKLAKQYSDDTGSKDDGGKLPPFSRTDPVAPEFLAAAFSLTNNQISDVVTTQYGYHIIQLLDKTPAKKLALTDKLPVGDMTLAEYFKDRLTGQKLQDLAPAYIEKLSRSPGVEILDPTLKALWLAQTNAPAALPAK